jgi:hypothetical protein
MNFALTGDAVFFRRKRMTNKKNLRGILGIMLVSGFILAGCNHGNSSKDALDRTAWEAIETGEILGTSYTTTINLKFTSPNYEMSFIYTPALPAEIAATAPTLIQDMYTVSGSTVKLKLPEGYPMAEFYGTFSANELRLEGDEEGEPDTVFSKK